VKYFLKIGFKNKIEEVGSYAMVSGWNPMDVAEVEECVKIIIEKIKDEEQFNALVKSITTP
jgi:hypothetical protein